VCYCPVTTLTDHDLQSGDLTAAYADLIDGTESEHPQTYRDASPLHRVTGEEPPFLFVHGDADTTVPIEQSEAMTRRLAEASVRAEFQVLPGVGHGFGYGTTTEPQRKSLAFVEAFLESVFRTPNT
jgi:dipeptidyl aminopeptidase/acylaminoacyl peptidase